MPTFNNKKSYDLEEGEEHELHGPSETAGNHRRKSVGTKIGCCTCSKKCWITTLKNNVKVILLIIAIFAGTALGFLMREFEIHKDPRKVMYVAFIGDIFLRMLKIVILPLIVSSLVSGLAALESQTSGKIGLRAVIYYFTTTVMAVILGIILVTVIQPGKVGTPTNESDDSSTPEPITTADTFLDLIRNMFPPNLVSATFRQYKTSLVRPPPPKNATGNATFAANITTSTPRPVIFNASFANTTNPTEKPPLPDYSGWIIKGTEIEGINIMGLVVFSIVFGITISKLGEKGKPMMLFFESLNEATMNIVAAIMWLAPLGITFLVAGQVLLVKDFSVMLMELGWYFLTVLTGLLVHAFVVLPLIFLMFTRSNPFKFIVGSLQAFATGFATSSSSATLPITIRCVEENNGVDPRITRFVLPIGSTINMDGTALYEAVACLFIAQTQNVEMDAGKIVAVSITATAAAIGAAGVPQAGLVTMVMVLNAVGLDAKHVSMILAIDWFLDRIRTTVNILGDVIGCGIVQHMSKGFLAKMDEEQKLKRRASRAQRLQEVMEDVEVEAALLPKNEKDRIVDNTV